MTAAQTPHERTAVDALPDIAPMTGFADFNSSKKFKQGMERDGPFV
jgi:hypothetical protein